MSTDEPGCMADAAAYVQGWADELPPIPIDDPRPLDARLLDPANE